MKKLLISAGAVTALALSTPAFAANTATANATVNIVSPLSLTKTADMDFGTIVGPFAGEDVELDTSGNVACPGTLTCSGSPTAAAFDVTGTPDQQLTLVIPASVTLNGSVSGTLDVDLTTDLPADPLLDNTGAASFSLGGTLNIPNGTVDGVYSNTFNVTANYQ